MNSLPPYFPSQNFNALAFQNGTNLTKADLDKLYLPLAAGKNLYLIDAIVPGVVSASKAVIVDASKNITGFNSIGISRATGDLLSLSATDAASRCSILMTAPSNSLELGVRSDGLFTGHYYRYANGAFRFVQNSTTGNSQHFGQFLIDTSGSHLTLKNSSETSLIEHGLSSLRISSSVCPALLSLTSIGVNISSNGNHLTLRNGAQTSFFEETSSGILRTVSGLSMNLDSNGLRIDSLGNTASARSRLDLGDSVSNKTLGIYNNGTSFYGLSANNNQLQFSSNSAFAWYTACTDASPINTTRLTLASNGVLTLTENAIMPRGFFVAQNGFSGAGRTGIGLACHMANISFAELFTWDYTNSLWKDLKINNTMYVNGTNSFVQIGANPGNPIYPLAVSGNFTTSFAGSYGYLNSSGAGSGSSTGSVPVTCFLQHRLWCSEVNAFSDRRLKENFKEIDEDDAVEFVKKIKPFSYNWKSDKNKNINIGYVAQDILKLRKFDSLVSVGPDEDLNEEIDEDGLVSPAKHRFLVSYQSAIPVLHAALKHALEEIEMLKLFIKNSSKK